MIRIDFIRTFLPVSFDCTYSSRILLLSQHPRLSSESHDCDHGFGDEWFVAAEGEEAGVAVSALAVVLYVVLGDTVGDEFFFDNLLQVDEEFSVTFFDAVRVACEDGEDVGAYLKMAPLDARSHPDAELGNVPTSGSDGA